MSKRAAVDVYAQRDAWQQAGAVVIPLRADSKTPAAGRSWLTTPSAAQWQTLPAGKACNLGIVCGAGHAVIDADNAEAVRNVDAQLAGLGILDQMPIERTPNGGRHYHAKLVEVPHGFNYALLARQLGAGELRAANCYVVAAPSTVAGRPYVFEQGGPHTLPALRVMAWRDFDWLLPAGAVAVDRVQVPPVRLLERSAGGAVEALLDKLGHAQARTRRSDRLERGHAVGKYASTSQAEAAVIAILILRGWPFDAIADLFQQAPPAHYRLRRAADASADAVLRAAYLRATYANVLAELAGNATRRQLALAWRTVEQAGAAGEGAEAERRVLLAMLAHAWQVDALTFCASRRDLALHAQLSGQVVDAARQRLHAARLIKVRRPRAEAAIWQGLRYTLDADFVAGLAAGLTAGLIRYNSCHRSQLIEGVLSAAVPPGNDRRTLAAAAVVWARQHCGPASKNIYMGLGSAAQPVRTLAAAAGLSVGRAERALLRLASHGLAVQVAEGAPPVRSGAGRPACKLVAYWLRGPVDVAELASRLADVGAVDRVEAERDAWRQRVQDWAKRGTLPPTSRHSRQRRKRAQR